MGRGRFQFGLRALMIGVAIVAVDCWLFTVGPLAAIVGMVVSKHVLVAYLCMRMDQTSKAEEKARTSLARRAITRSPAGGVVGEGELVRAA